MSCISTDEVWLYGFKGSSPSLQGGCMVFIMLLLTAPATPPKCQGTLSYQKALSYHTFTTAKYGESENMPTERLPHGGAGAGGD